jgi:hypothetical protein
VAVERSGARTCAGSGPEFLFKLAIVGESDFLRTDHVAAGLSDEEPSALVREGEEIAR